MIQFSFVNLVGCRWLVAGELLTISNPGRSFKTAKAHTEQNSARCLIGRGPHHKKGVVVKVRKSATSQAAIAQISSPTSLSHCSYFSVMPISSIHSNNTLGQPCVGNDSYP
jgi:hypothetical protein